jgi:hypothetical protein
MKTYITVILVLIFSNSYSQNGIWIGGGLGLMLTESVGKQGIEPASFSFSMPITWRKNNWLIETTPTYCGAVLWNLNGGYSIPLGGDTSLDLLAGINDALDISTDKFQIVHRFDMNYEARLQWRDFYCSANKINSTYIFSIGVRCLSNKTN